MKCPKCQFENPDAVKFCGECGAKLERFCPKCKGVNPLQFKFCGECGSRIDQPDAPQQKPAPMPRYLAEKIFALEYRTPWKGEGFVSIGGG